MAEWAMIFVESMGLNTTYPSSPQTAIQLVRGLDRLNFNNMPAYLVQRLQDPNLLQEFDALRQAVNQDGVYALYPDADLNPGNAPDQARETIDQLSIQEQRTIIEGLLREELQSTQNSPWGLFGGNQWLNPFKVQDPTHFWGIIHLSNNKWTKGGVQFLQNLICKHT
ncbi:hypothetical protein BT96DRAFT_940479 [Gymnopus androsaceus JB14]|uniref:Uncharacterized protein n=1 Tax=Gymnopus androsaceus JB14 TaxID=1447944 RepID=A0A6A4HKU1_9AGAR|nr:hypothetical protein BT96DRAFT_940479 [Gymnopus androsaceus JB14]